jgi:hypothetical protein
MAGIETSQTFANNDQVTATKLNNIIIDGNGTSTGTIYVNASGVLSAGKIDEANINDNQVSLGKLAQIADGKVLGNISGGTANVSEVSTTDVSKAGFTPQAYTAGESITFPNALVMKMGRTAVSGTTTAITFAGAFTGAILSVQVTPEKSGTDLISASIDNIATDHFDVNHTDGTTHIMWVAIGYDT